MQLQASKRAIGTAPSDKFHPRATLTGKRAALFAFVVVVVAGAIWALWPKPVAVDLATVTRGHMSVKVEEEGKTRIRDVFVVSAPQSGKMLRSPLLAGDPVEKGLTVVAVIQSSEPPFLDVRARLEATAHAEAAEASVRLAEAELAQAQSELAFAESELVRARALSRSNTISVRALERASHEVEVRKAVVTKAEASRAVRQRERESARARLIFPNENPHAGAFGAGCCIDVRAPESGRVLRVLHTSEQAVQIGTPLVEIGNPGKQEIVVDLLSTDAVKVRGGDPAVIDGWGGVESLPAKVRRVETAGFTKVSALGIEEQRVRVILDLEKAVDEGTRLGHEYRVFIRITVWENADVVRLPIGALFRHEGRWFVFKLDGTRVRAVSIEVGHRNAEVGEVLSGLNKGDLVVLHPSDRVASGVRVADRRTSGD